LFSEILNGKSLRRRGFHSRLFAIALSLIMICKLSASVMRIDGGFEDWKDVKVCAYDPKGDAKGAFDITKVYAASQGPILYLRFETTNLLNLQNGPESEGTLLVIIDLPNNQELVLDMIIEKKVYGLKDWLIPNLIGESVVTWRGGPHASFSAGKLDYIVYNTRTLIPKNGFILNSELLNRTERKQLSLDAADSKLSDHLLMTVDFQFSDSQEN